MAALLEGCHLLACDAVNHGAQRLVMHNRAQLHVQMEMKPGGARAAIIESPFGAKMRKERRATRLSDDGKWWRVALLRIPL